VDKTERVIFRGQQVAKGWPEKIMAAQQIPSYSFEGKAIARIRYGDEHDDWGADRQECHDCAVIKGELHVPSCDVEECPVCGGQVLSCDCDFDEYVKET